MAQIDQGHDLQELFLDGLRDIFYGENKILKTLPRMAATAQHTAVSEAFQRHSEETRIHVERLYKVFEMMRRAPRGKICPAIDGIIEENAEIIMEDYEGTPAIDAGLIACAQAMEHYEIARYRTLLGWAMELGMPEASKLLKATLTEEREIDAMLARLAQNEVNWRALR